MTFNLLYFERSLAFRLGYYSKLLQKSLKFNCKLFSLTHNLKKKFCARAVLPEYSNKLRQII